MAPEKKGTDVRRRARKAVRARLRDLRVARGVTMDVIVGRLAEERGRPLELVAENMPAAGPFGYWRADRDRDIIVYPANATPEFQRHIVCHELCHILLGHSVERDGCKSDSPDEAAAPVSAMAARFMQKWNTLNRSSYESTIEREAERGASALKRWVRPLDSHAPNPNDPSVRIHDAFGGGTQL